MMTEKFWRKHSAWNDKRRARKVARALNEPGEDRVYVRVKKETWWRVEYADPKGVLNG